MVNRIIFLSFAFFGTIFGMENAIEELRKEAAPPTPIYQFVQLASVPIPVPNNNNITSHIPLSVFDNKRGNVLLASKDNVLILNKALQNGGTLGCQKSVQGLLLSADNQHLIVNTGDIGAPTNPSSVNIFDLDSNQCVSTYQSQLYCSDFAELPDNNIVLALWIWGSNSASYIYIWDWKNNNIVAQWPCNDVFPAFGIQTTADPLCYPKNLILVSAWADGMLRWINGDTGVCCYTANIDPGHGNYNQALNSTFIKGNQVISPFDEKIKIFNLGMPWDHTKNITLTAFGFVDHIADVADDTTILSCQTDSNHKTTICVWDISAQKPSSSWIVPNGHVHALQSLSNNIVLTAQGNPAITNNFTLWDVKGTKLAQQDLPQGITYISPVQDDLILVVSCPHEQDTVTLWQIVGLSESHKKNTKSLRKAIAYKTKDEIKKIIQQIQLKTSSAQKVTNSTAANQKCNV